MSTLSSNQPTGPNDGANHAALHRQECMRRIAELEEEIRTVKESYNSASPAYRLPPEILSTIFLATFARAMEVVDHDDKLYMGQLQWMAATQVCQRWRQIALDCTELWSTLSLVNPDITALMLERSKQAPLTIDFCADPDDGRPPCVYGDALQTALSQVHRLRSVKYYRTDNYIPDTYTEVPLRETLRNWTDAEASVLEYLYLHATDSLPIPFLRGGAPVLKRLEIVISPCFPSLNGLHAPNLTYLSIYSWGSESPSPPPTPEDFMGTLSQFPRLEVLILHNALPYPTNMAAYNSTHQRLRFARLKRLELTDPVTDTMNFLAACQLPDNAAVQLSCEARDAQNPFDMQLLHQLLQEVFIRGRSASSNRPATRFKIAKLEVYWISWQQRWQFWLPLHEAATFELNPDFEISTPKRDFTLHNSLQCFRESLDFSALSTLSLHDGPDLTHAEWRTNFGELPLLETIEIWGDTKDLFKALGRVSAPDVPPRLGEMTLYFPALSTLSVFRAYNTPTYTRKDFQKLLRMLSDRSRADLPIEYVMVAGGETLEEEVYESLRQEAPESTVGWRE